MARWIPVLALLAGLAGCGGSDPQPVAERDVCGAKIREFEGATTRLTYRGGDDVVADVAVLCRRLRALKIEHQVQGLGRDRLVIEAPSKDAAAVRATVRPGRLALYDWEAAVVGPSGKPAPGDPKVTGGTAAGESGALELYGAIQRASKRPPEVEPDDGREGSVFYAVDPATRDVFANGAGGFGSATRAAALEAVPVARRDRAKVREVNPNTMLARAPQAAEGGAKADRWFVLEDDIALPGTEIEQPEQNFDGGSGAPIVTFEFSERGAEAFAELTRELARRGARSDADQHFAIVLDDEIVSVPFVDFRQNPDGIDGSTGSQISGGFTVASARRLATILSTGALPVPLELVAPK